jgi:hypothetical protein
MDKPGDRGGLLKRKGLCGWSGQGPCARGPDALQRTGVPRPHSVGWFSPVPRLSAVRQCIPRASAAGDLAAPHPDESFEA